MNLDELKQTVVDALEDIKAKDIEVMDVSHLTSMTECMIVASADSNRQTRALANHVQEKVKEKGGAILGKEGEAAGEWVLLDLGEVVVHVMHPAVRQYYNLEELWGGQSGHLTEIRSRPAVPKE
ncbi:MAG: ribosome silencing factor [Sulfuricellaceae bacterium]|nr:ribosome silencing factor [Sulfuricellaceae bacterium]